MTCAFTLRIVSVNTLSKPNLSPPLSPSLCRKKKSQPRSPQLLVPGMLQCTFSAKSNRLSSLQFSFDPTVPARQLARASMLQGRTSPGMAGMMAGMLGMGGVDGSAAIGPSPDTAGRCDDNGWMTSCPAAVLLLFVCGDSLYMSVCFCFWCLCCFLLIRSESFRFVSFHFLLVLSYTRYCLHFPPRK